MQTQQFIYFNLFQHSRNPTKPLKIQFIVLIVIKSQIDRKVMIESDKHTDTVSELRDMVHRLKLHSHQRI